jgi:hypothetical protein
MLALAICHVLEDLAGSKARRRPLPLPDLRPAARLLRGRLAAAWAAGRAALRAAAGAAGACVALAVLAAPLVWSAMR